MFETIEPDRYFRLRMFALHQLAALLLPPLLSGLAYLAIPALAEPVGWAAGPVLGAVAANASREKQRRGYEACWVWVFPLAQLVVAVLWDLRNNPPDLVLKSYFDAFWRDPNAAEPGLSIGLITFPAWSCCSYSLSYLIARQWQSRKRVEVSAVG